MIKWILIISGIIALVFFVAMLVGKTREASKAAQMAEELLDGSSRPASGAVDFGSLSELPDPVARYFQHALVDGQTLIKSATMQQSGVLRTTTAKESWSPFTASQVVVPPATGFLWNARIEMPLGSHVRVLDSYIKGEGAGRVSLFSAFAVASDSGVAELNSGALHRYLAEAVWFPTALLPQSGVVWSPIDEHSALATLTDSGTAVSLEFRFNDLGEVTGVYSEGRFGSFDGQYRQVPWEGHFRDYQVQGGMRVPLYGEVGWYHEGTLQLVWKGDIIDAQYEFEP